MSKISLVLIECLLLLFIIFSPVYYYRFADMKLTWKVKEGRLVHKWQAEIQTYAA